MASKVPIMLLLLAALVVTASAATAIEGPKAKPVKATGKKDRKLLVAASKTGPKELPVPEFVRSGRKLTSSVAAVFPSSRVGGSTVITAGTAAKADSKGRKLMNGAVGSAVNAQRIIIPVAKTSGSTATSIIYPSGSTKDRKLTSVSDSKSYKPVRGHKVGAIVGSDGRRLMTSRRPMPSQAFKTPTAKVGGNRGCSILACW